MTPNRALQDLVTKQQDHIEELRVQLVESKQREATLALSNRDSQRLINELNHDLSTLTLERDAANNALEIARTALLDCSDPVRSVRWIRQRASAAFRQLDKTPTAALAERDRAIGRKTAERVINMCYNRGLGLFAQDVAREFGLDPKPEVR